MFVCVCNAVSDRDIAAARAQGCSSLDELAMRTGCGTTCGCCLDVAQQILHGSDGAECASSRPFALAVAA